MANPVILYDVNQQPMNVENGVAIPANTQGVLVLGSDGTNARNIKVSATGVVATDGSGSTQPVSAASLPLPAGASTAALQTQPGVDIGDVTVNNAAGAAAVNIQDGGNSITVDGTVAVSGTVPISAASLPLPTGAATAALQTQPGVDIGDVTVNNAAGAAAVNIQDGGNSITVDGTVAVSGSVAVTGPLTDAQLRATPVPVSGTVTANIGTTNGLALDATLTGGTQKAIVRGGAKGTTTAADVTSTNQSADRQALDVQIRTSAGVVVDTFGGGTQFADGAARGTATGTLQMLDDGTNIQSSLGDTSGRQIIVGAAAQGAAVAGNPILLGAENAAGNVQRLQTTVVPPIDGDEGLVVRQVVAQTAAVTQVAGSAASVTLLAANTARQGATIYNDSTKAWFVKFGTTASATSYTVQVASQAYYEVPFGYTGRIDAIQATANGNAYVTELT